MSSLPGSRVPQILQQRSDTGMGLGFGLHEPQDDLFSIGGQSRRQQNLFFPEYLSVNQDRNKLQIIKMPRHEVLQGFLGLFFKDASSGGAAESKTFGYMRGRLAKFALGDPTQHTPHEVLRKTGILRMKTLIGLHGHLLVRLCVANSWNLHGNLGPVPEDRAWIGSPTLTFRVGMLPRNPAMPVDFRLYN